MSENWTIQNRKSESPIKRKETLPTLTGKKTTHILFLKDFGGDENFHIFRVFITGEDERDLTPFKTTRVSIIDWLDDYLQRSYSY